MSGIYISGMKMPKCCAACVLDGFCKHWDIRSDRHEECPLIPVPVHGRLIDASVRCDVQMYDDQYEDFEIVNMSIDDLLDRSWIELEKDPTIIPADKEAGNE